MTTGNLLPRNSTRAIDVGSTTIGAGNPIVVQSMCATSTSDIDLTSQQVQALADAGAGVVRLAVDSRKEAQAALEIAARVDANLCIDLQENWRLAQILAPGVAKIRYNPGHLHHHERSLDWQEKVRRIASWAAEGDTALRIGVNCGSVDPAMMEAWPAGDSISPMVASALEHAEFLDSIGFDRYVVSLKDSDPNLVIEANRRFAEQRPEVPLHLGVTEAGLPPDGIIKTRIAFEQLISRGIGDTVRVSLTLPNPQKSQEVTVGHEILEDISQGRVRSVVQYQGEGPNIISCPSCSRVENEAFVELAQQVKQMSSQFSQHDITIAVMGCRVNGPGETDDADLGLWCAPSFVNLKRGSKSLGSYPYEQILQRLQQEIETLIGQRGSTQ
ncbi:MAG TPA: (E)-4-hydroxy-3-methylbut-2-enyl-diphosphate synthase [Planctomycetes bacterium]|nr:(E)-4-hydroxy-3-methylbut-2-enyl-diphosphate synthase [Planctomycetota bacterium]HIK82127.1 4-hydroxy-3-methylbut-2-en-1-yl diphosphate synthase [Planctomycetota bacterium]